MDLNLLGALIGEMDISMVTDSGEEVRDRFIMAQNGIKLEEKLWVDECFLFQEESLTPIFCKPKLIPLKTITTQNLEKMQKEQMEKLQVPEKEQGDHPESIEGDSPREEEPSTSEVKEADVWTADD